MLHLTTGLTACDTFIHNDSGFTLLGGLDVKTSENHPRAWLLARGRGVGAAADRDHHARLVVRQPQAWADNPVPAGAGGQATDDWGAHLSPHVGRFAPRLPVARR